MSFCQSGFSNLEWLNEPAKWNIHDPSGELEGSQGNHEILADGKILKIHPPATKDFWARTFYSPLLIKHDASGLLGNVPHDAEATVKVDFEFVAHSQFDQAGILIYLDSNTWVKCGIEYCDGTPRLSVVVCNIFSDWSTQKWNGFSVRLKIHKIRQSNSFVVEAAPTGTEDYQFIRIAHLSSRTSYNGADIDAVSAAGSSVERDWRIGPFAACPISQKGCVATFTNFSIGEKEASEHSENL